MGRPLAIALLVLVACGSRKDDAQKQPPIVPEEPKPVVVPPPAAPPFEVPPPTDKLIAIGRGERHACVVRASGAVDCWGNRTLCKGCDLLGTPDPTVHRVAGISDAVAVSGDGRCFVRKTGEAACLKEGVYEVEPVKGIEKATAVDPFSRCYIVGAGKVQCVDFDGKAWIVPNITDAVSLSGGTLMTCALRKTGQVSCGNYGAAAAWDPVRNLVNVTSFAVTGTSGGASWGCAVIAGTTKCFALDMYREPGVPLLATEKEPGEEYSDDYSLRDPKPFAGATQLQMWSDNDRRFHLQAVVAGEIVTSDNSSTTVLPMLSDATIATKECAIRAQGSLVCWGTNSGGVLAQPSTLMSEANPPTTVVGLGDVADLALGMSRSFALTRKGEVYSWGFEGAWTTPITIPSPIPLGLGPSRLVQIVADWKNDVCMRSDDGLVWCRLDGGIVQLDTSGVADIQPDFLKLFVLKTDGRAELHTISGIEYETGSLRIEDVGGDIVQVSQGGDRLCGRRRDGTVNCQNAGGDLKGITQLTGGRYEACALQRGRVWCWEMGFDVKSAPAEVASLRDVTDVASNDERGCAVHDGGRVSCWYYDETTVDNRHVFKLQVPVEVLAGGAVDVEIGYGRRGQFSDSQSQTHGPAPAGEYACAIMTDRTVKCWGMNPFGELGDGSFAATVSPIGVKL